MKMHEKGWVEPAAHGLVQQLGGRQSQPGAAGGGGGQLLGPGALALKAVKAQAFDEQRHGGAEAAEGEQDEGVEEVEEVRLGMGLGPYTYRAYTYTVWPSVGPVGPSWPSLGAYIGRVEPSIGPIGIQPPAIGPRRQDAVQLLRRMACREATLGSTSSTAIFKSTARLAVSGTLQKTR